MSLVAWAQRNLMDFHQKFVNAGLQVFLRTRNVDDTALPYTELGLQVAATDLSGGVTDTLVYPPPDVTPLDTKDIGLLGTRLQFGPHRFLVSHTFVLQRMSANGYTDPFQVWRANNVVGFYYNSRLYAIESIQDIADAGELISWEIIASAHEEQVTTP